MSSCGRRHRTLLPDRGIMKPRFAFCGALPMRAPAAGMVQNGRAAQSAPTSSTLAQQVGSLADKWGAYCPFWSRPPALAATRLTRQASNSAHEDALRHQRARRPAPRNALAMAELRAVRAPRAPSPSFAAGLGGRRATCCGSGRAAHAAATRARPFNTRGGAVPTLASCHFRSPF